MFFLYLDKTEPEQVGKTHMMPAKFSGGWINNPCSIKGSLIAIKGSLDRSRTALVEADMNQYFFISTLHSGFRILSIKTICQREENRPNLLRKFVLRSEWMDKQSELSNIQSTRL